jgi:hypothetical protein
MMVVATTFFMNSIKASSPNVAICVTRMTYICALYAVQAIIIQEVSKVGVLRASHKIFLSLTGKFE